MDDLDDMMQGTSSAFDEAAMPHSSNAIPNSESWFGTPQADDGPSLFEADNDDPLDPSFITEEVTEPDASLIEPPKRSPKAKQYERKMRGLFRMGFLVTARSPRTTADAATIMLYGPDIAQAAGDLAAENKWAAQVIDMMTEGTDNAAAALMMASVPFVLQLFRNHEPVAEVSPEREIRIPFTRRSFRIKFRFKLKRTRALTNPPEQVVEHVFGNEKIREALAKQGIIIK